MDIVRTSALQTWSPSSVKVNWCQRERKTLEISFSGLDKQIKPAINMEKICCSFTKVNLVFLDKANEIQQLKASYYKKNLIQKPSSVCLENQFGKKDK